MIVMISKNKILKKNKVLCNQLANKLIFSNNILLKVCCFCSIQSYPELSSFWDSNKSNRQVLTVDRNISASLSSSFTGNHLNILKLLIFCFIHFSLTSDVINSIINVVPHNSGGRYMTAILQRSCHLFNWFKNRSCCYKM